MSDIQFLPKSGTYKRGLALLNNGAKRTIILVHGIDEANPEDLAGLKKCSSWGGWLNIINIANKYGYNIIWTNSSQENTTDEIDYAIQYSRETLNAPVIHLLGYSWGGRRIRLWVSRNLLAAKQIATVMRVSSGGVDVDDWTNTVAANLPTWLIHAVDDQRTSYNNSLVSYENARKLAPNAPVWYTQFNAGLDARYKGHNMLQFVGEMKIAASYRTDKRYMNDSKLTLPQWWEMNEWARPTAPDAEYRKKPATAPVPTKQALYIIWSDGTWSEP